MAELNNDFFELNGSVGNLVFRKVNGKRIVQSAPDNRNIVSELVLKTIYNFTIVQNIYSAFLGTKENPTLNSIRLLWRKIFPERIAINAIFTRENFKNVITVEDIPLLRMSPSDNFFSFPENELRYAGDNFSLVIPKLDISMGLNQYTENLIEASGFMLMTDPINEGIKKYRVEPIYSRDPHEVQYEQEMTFDLHYIPSAYYPMYRKKAVYMVLVSLIDKDQPVRASDKMVFHL